MGGHHHVRPRLQEQLLQMFHPHPGQGHIPLHVAGQAVEQVIQAAAILHQPPKHPVEGGGQLRHGVVKKIHGVHLVPLPLQLLLQGLRGRPVSHTKFSG